MEIVDPLQQATWDEWLFKNGVKTLFNTQAWARTLIDTYNFKPYYLVKNTAEQNILIPLMEVRNIRGQRRAVSLPFSDRCDLILEGEAQKILQSTLELGKERGWVDLEFRSPHPVFGEEPGTKHYLEHVIELTAGSKLYAAFSANTRRNIRKALRSKLKIEIDNRKSGLQSFYRLHCLTRKRHGLPVQPKRFFNNLYKNFIKQAKGDIFVAKFKGRPVAANFYLYSDDVVTFKFGASDKNFQATRPVNLLFWQSIIYYAEKGFRLLHLGRTSIKNSGLLRFKRGWGAKESRLVYHSYDCSRGEVLVTGEEALVEMIQPVLRKLPLSCLQLLGKMLYRYWS